MSLSVADSELLGRWLERLGSLLILAALIYYIGRGLQSLFERIANRVEKSFDHSDSAIALLAKNQAEQNLLTQRQLDKIDALREKISEHQTSLTSTIVNEGKEIRHSFDNKLQTVSLRLEAQLRANAAVNTTRTIVDSNHRVESHESVLPIAIPVRSAPEKEKEK